MATAEYEGSLTLGACLPGAAAAQLAGEAGLNLVLPSIQARLDAASAANLQLGVSPPSLAATVAAAAQLALEILPPDVTGQISVSADLVAELQLLLGQIQAQLALVAAFGLTLGAAGVHLYSVVGRADELGPAVRSVTIGGLPGGAPSDHVVAVLLAASAPAAQAALSATTGLELT